MVFRLCLSYAAAFGITWPILAVAVVKGVDMDVPYGFWVFVTATAAMQGFNNALCYFQLMKSFRGGFSCRGLRKRNICDFCRDMACRGERIATRLPLDMLHRTSNDPRSLDEISSTASDQSPYVDPAVELANLSDHEEDDSSVTSSTEESTEKVTTKLSAHGEEISKVNLVRGSGLTTKQQGRGLSPGGSNAGPKEDSEAQDES